jgi:hypothetical protein
VAVLVVAFFAARGCASRGDVSREEAVRIAVEAVDFEPKCHQVKFNRRGIKSIPIWNVSLWTLNEGGNFDRISVVVVDARNGRVIQVVRNASGQGTPAQCVAPV